MALRRWGWVLGPALAAALVAIAVLPPRVPGAAGSFGSLFGPSYEIWIPPDPHGAAVKAALRTQRVRLRARALADSIIRLARGPGALRSSDGAVALVYAPPIPRDSAKVWLEAASAELALYPTAGARGLPVVVALASTPMRSRNVLEQNLLGELRLGFQSVAASSGACVVVLDLTLLGTRRYDVSPMARDAAGRPLGRFLDLCALYARFGVPGPAVSQWADRSPAWYWNRYDRLSLRMQEARRTLRSDTVGALSPYSGFWYGALDWMPASCLRGQTEVCARVAGFERGVDYRWWWGTSLTRGQLVAWLLATGTPSQFAAFWRSSLPARPALEAAYGRPAGRLALEALRHWASAPGPAGPRLGAPTLLAGLTWAGLAVLLAVVAGRRWTAQG